MIVFKGCSPGAKSGSNHPPAFTLTQNEPEENNVLCAIFNDILFGICQYVLVSVNNVED